MILGNESKPLAKRRKFKFKTVRRQTKVNQGLCSVSGLK